MKNKTVCRRGRLLLVSWITRLVSCLIRSNFERDLSFPSSMLLAMVRVCGPIGILIGVAVFQTWHSVSLCTRIELVPSARRAHPHPGYVVSWSRSSPLTRDRLSLVTMPVSISRFWVESLSRGIWAQCLAPPEHSFLIVVVSCEDSLSNEYVGSAGADVF